MHGGKISENQRYLQCEWWDLDNSCTIRKRILRRISVVTRIAARSVSTAGKFWFFTFFARFWISRSNLKLLQANPCLFRRVSRNNFSFSKQNKISRKRGQCEQHEHRRLRLNPTQTKLFHKNQLVSRIMDLSASEWCDNEDSDGNPRSSAGFSILNCSG